MKRQQSKLKRTTELKRTGWQRTGAYIPPKNKIKPRNSTRLQSQWRKDCEKVRPVVCVAHDAGYGPCEGRMECDHIKPKSQGGLFVVANGAFLCQKHHMMKTDGKLKYRREWLDPDQLEHLVEVGWVRWTQDGWPVGNGWKHFEPTTSAQEAWNNERVEA